MHQRGAFRCSFRQSGQCEGLSIVERAAEWFRAFLCVYISKNNLSVWNRRHNSVPIMTIKEAKLSLENEVKDSPYTKENPFGNAGSYRKLIDFLYTCTVSNEISREEAKDWLFKLYNGQDQKDNSIFRDRIDVIITAFEYLKDHGKIK